MLTIRIATASSSEFLKDQLVSPIEAVFLTLDDKIVTRTLKPVFNKLFLACQAFVSVGLSVWIWRTIREIIEQVELIIIRAESTLSLFKRIHPKNHGII